MPKPNYIKHRPLYSSSVPKNVKTPKIKWKILPIMWMGFKRLCFLIGFSMIMSALIGVYTASLFEQQAAPKLPDQMVLYVEFDEGFKEVAQPASLSEPFGQQHMTVRRIVDAIDTAAQDDRVKGMIARMNSGGFAMAHIQEVRGAIKRFRESGKFAHIYSSSFGEAGGGLGRYYLASVFDEIWMQPLGVVTVAGVKAEVPFLRDVLDKIGITPNFFQREDYKTAYESLTNNSMSRENRETLEGIVNEIRTTIMTDIPADRGMSPEEFASLVDKGLFTAGGALEAGLITHMDYADVLVDRIETELTGSDDPDKQIFVGLQNYARRSMAENHETLMDTTFAAKRPTVALIYAVGAIMDDDKGGPSPLGTGIASAEEIGLAIIDATEDDRVNTIILRVDSPGGSPVASERILRTIDKARQKGKKVIVSMGPTAASGGYWIAAHADRIFASETTITGSIGVVGGKFAAGDLMDKIGINWDSVQWGENAGIWSFNAPFSPSEAERINLMLDAVYDAFLERVSEGRKMSVEDVRKIAGGRVWSGRQALDVGLVDEVGGFHEVLKYVATLEGVEDPAKLNLVVLQRPKTPIEQFIELIAESGAVYEGLRIQSVLSEVIKPYVAGLQVIGNAQNSAVYNPIRIE